MKRPSICLAVAAALLIIAPAQAGLTAFNAPGGIGPPQWHFGIHATSAVPIGPSWVWGITAPGLSGTGLNFPVAGAFAVFTAGRPGPNTITWHIIQIKGVIPTSFSLTSFVQSAPGDVSAPIGSAFYIPGGVGPRIPAAVAPGMMVGVVPSPGSVSLGAIGLLGLIVAKRRRRGSD